MLYHNTTKLETPEIQRSQVIYFACISYILGLQIICKHVLIEPKNCHHKFCLDFNFPVRENKSTLQDLKGALYIQKQKNETAH